jgi:hypothetical protein
VHQRRERAGGQRGKRDLAPRERRAVDWRGFLSDYCLVSQEESPRSLGRVIRTLFARRDDSLCATAGAHFAALRLAARLTAAVITTLLG